MRKSLINKFVWLILCGYTLLAMSIAGILWFTQFNFTNNLPALVIYEVTKIVLLAGMLYFIGQHLINKPLALLSNKLVKVNNDLIESQHKLFTIIDAMPSIIIGLTETGLITAWNAHAEKITGLKFAAVKDQPLALMVPAYKDYLPLARTAIVSNNIQKQTRSVNLINHEKHYVDVVAYPIKTTETINAVVRIDDVTMQVRFEEIMAQTEKMNSIGSLAAGVAHEINNPLGAIMQGSQNILRRIDVNVPKNQEIAQGLNTDILTINNYLEKRQIIEFLEGIRRSGQRAADIVRNLLQFARHEDVQQKAMHNLAKIIDTAINLASADYDLKKKTDFRHIQIIKDYAADIPDVYCCALEIEQVVLNLLKNAAYALGAVARRPMLYIKLWQNKNKLILEIEDNGPGISEDTRKRIFEPFFTTKPVGEGTGLGLSVSYNIITKLHNGSLTVESVVGVGTKFIIVLPVVKNPVKRVNLSTETVDNAVS